MFAHTYMHTHTYIQYTSLKARDFSTTYDLLQPARDLLGSLSSINLFSSWVLEENGGEMLEE